MSLRGMRFLQAFQSDRIGTKEVPTFFTKSGPFYSHRIRFIPEGCSPAEPFPFRLMGIKIGNWERELIERIKFKNLNDKKLQDLEKLDWGPNGIHYLQHPLTRMTAKIKATSPSSLK